MSTVIDLSKLASSIAFAPIAGARKHRTQIGCPTCGGCGRDSGRVSDDPQKDGRCAQCEGDGTVDACAVVGCDQAAVGDCDSCGALRCDDHLRFADTSAGEGCFCRSEDEHRFENDCDALKAGCQ